MNRIPKFHHSDYTIPSSTPHLPRIQCDRFQLEIQIDYLDDQATPSLLSDLKMFQPKIGEKPMKSPILFALLWLRSGHWWFHHQTISWAKGSRKTIKQVCHGFRFLLGSVHSPTKPKKTMESSKCQHNNSNIMLWRWELFRCMNSIHISM